MLLKKIDKLNDYYKYLNNVKKEKFELSIIEDINSKLQISVNRLRSIILAFSNLNVSDKYRISTIINNKPDFSSVLNIIKKLEEQIDKNISITKPEIKKLINELDLIERPIRENWEKYLTINSQNAINLIEMIKPLIGNSDDFVILLYDLKNYKRKWPISKKEIILFRNKLMQCENKINELDINDEIQVFLIKVLSGEAVIDDLDLEILNWIRSHNFAFKLAINFRSI